MFYEEYLIDERIKTLKNYHISDLQNIYKKYACGSKAFRKEELIKQLAHYEVWINENNPGKNFDITKGLTKTKVRNRKMTYK